jgi:hypothetical protein
VGTLSDAERQAVIAKARADAAEDGLPPTVEDVGARRGIGALLIRVKNASGQDGRETLTKSPRPVAERGGGATVRPGGAHREV